MDERPTSVIPAVGESTAAELGMLLRLEDLRVEFPTSEGTIHAVNGVNISLRQGQRLGIVGESGSGKTATVSALLGMTAENGRASGRVIFEGRDLMEIPSSELRSIRGGQIALVPQDPSTALSPVRRVGTQMSETLRQHFDLDQKAARQACIEALISVQIPSPERQLAAYPFELSGGMLQRVCIAMAMLCSPKLLIADEATTALDVSVQAGILSLLGRVAEARSMALIMVSHDLSVIAGLCDSVAVMYAGQIVEHAPTSQLYARPRHPYSAALLDCRPTLAPGARRRWLTSIPGQPPDGMDYGNFCSFNPRCSFAVSRCYTERPGLIDIDGEPGHQAACWRSGEALALTAAERPGALRPEHGASSSGAPGGAVLEARQISVNYRVRPPGSLRAVALKAVEEVSFRIDRGRTLGVVGESGCGKSTVGRAVLGLQRLAAGSVHFAGLDLSGMNQSALRPIRPRMQLVVQSSSSSFDPRHTIGHAIAEAVGLDPSHRRNFDRRVLELLEMVELPARIVGALPAEVSGGQRQRASIARALATKPELIVADEPTAALDVSVRAGIVNLLRRLQDEEGISYLFISHDLAAVGSMSDEVAVMYLGHVVERGPADVVLEHPAHPYTKALLQALPDLDQGGRRGEPIPGEVPSLLDPPRGCPFHPRCPRATRECLAERPPLAALPVPAVSAAAAEEPPGWEHAVACIHPLVEQNEPLQ